MKTAAVAAALAFSLCGWAQTTEFKNLQILKGAPPDRVNAVMNTFNRVLGVQCTHCHVEGAMEKEDKPQFGRTREMFKMRGAIAQEHKLNVSCWTCHRGSATPKKVEVTRTFWPGPLKLAPEQESKPAEEVYKNIQVFKGVPAARMSTIMNVFNASLGVQCGYCHTMGQWDKDDKEQKASARKMVAMVASIGPQYFKEAGTLTCFTCHHGAAKPEVNPPAAPNN